MKESLRLGNHEESTDTDTLLLFGGMHWQCWGRE
jgi:hypothetical protein